MSLIERDEVVLSFWECGHVEIDDGSTHECDGRDVCVVAEWKKYAPADDPDPACLLDADGVPDAGAVARLISEIADDPARAWYADRIRFLTSALLRHKSGSKWAPVGRPIRTTIKYGITLDVITVPIADREIVVMVPRPGQPGVTTAVRAYVIDEQLKAQL